MRLQTVLLFTLVLGFFGCDKKSVELNPESSHTIYLTEEQAKINRSTVISLTKALADSAFSWNELHCAGILYVLAGDLKIGSESDLFDYLRPYIEARLDQICSLKTKGI